MAANPKMLTITATSSVMPGTQTVEIECTAGDPFEHVGGKWLILHTGAVDGEKPIKRTYSLMPSPAHPARATMAIKRLGRGSNALCDAPVGTSLAFGGPWGKLTPETGLHPETLLIATDTGITSALGVVANARTRGRPAPQKLVWLRAEADEFLPSSYVRARVDEAEVAFDEVFIPMVNDGSRADAAHRIIDSHLRALAPKHVVAVGDGAIVHPLVGRLPGVEVRIECYFRNPEQNGGA